jgi:hypothetical protein
MALRRIPAAAVGRAAQLLPVAMSPAEAQIRQAAWVARCVGRGQSAPLRQEDVTALAAMLAVRTFPRVRSCSGVASRHRGCGSSVKAGSSCRWGQVAQGCRRAASLR